MVLYVVVGLAFAAAILRRDPVCTGRTLASAAIALPLWPLWGPFAFGGPSPDEDPSLERISSALDGAVAAVAGTALASVFGPRDAALVLRDVGEIIARRNGVVRVLADLEGGSAAGQRLALLVARDDARLDELGTLLAALRTELLVARALESRGDEAGDGALERVTTLIGALRGETG